MFIFAPRYVFKLVRCFLSSSSSPSSLLLLVYWSMQRRGSEFITSTRASQSALCTARIRKELVVPELSSFRKVVCLTQAKWRRIHNRLTICVHLYRALQILFVYLLRRNCHGTCLTSCCTQSLTFTLANQDIPAFADLKRVWFINIDFNSAFSKVQILDLCNYHAVFFFFFFQKTEHTSNLPLCTEDSKNEGVGWGKYNDHYLKTI